MVPLAALALTVVAASDSSKKLCGGAEVVDATADWVWSRNTVQSPSCTDPAPENPAKMCANDPTSVVIEGTGRPQCASSWMHDCKFNMRDLTQLDVDVSMLDCGGTWAAPLWMTPDYWAGGPAAGEIDMLENCPAESLYSNFAGGGTQKRWRIANPNGFHGHMTLWKVTEAHGAISIRVKTCTHKEAREFGGSCHMNSTAHLKDIYYQNGCKDGNCMYTMVSDIWNGWAGDDGYNDCASGEPKWGNECRFSVSNIRMQGVPFMGKCAALLGWPAPAETLTSISTGSLCMDLTENAAKPGIPIQAWGCDVKQPNAAQRWLYRDGHIVHRKRDGSEFCVAAPSKKNGQVLQLEHCKRSSNQQFRFRQGAIQTMDGAKCVDLRSEDGQTVQLWDCFPGAMSQLWSVQEVVAPAHIAVAVTSYQTSSCLDLRENREKSGTKLQVWPCNPLSVNAAQRWFFRDGQIMHITAAGKQLCLDVPENNMQNGKRLQVWECSGAPQQQFQYDGGMIKTLHGAKCLDLRVEDGKAVQIWECDSTQTNQQWLVTAVPTAVFV